MPGGVLSTERAWLIAHAPRTVTYTDEDVADGDDSAPPSSDEEATPDAPSARPRKSKKKGKKPGIPLSFKTAVANAAYDAASLEERAEVDNLFNSQATTTPNEGSVESRSL
jgi:hypothetical protein